MTNRRSYLWLLAAVVLIALALSATARAPGRRVSSASAVPSAPAPTAVALEVRDGALTPPVIQVRKGERIALRAVNTGSRECALALLGYEDRVPRIVLSPGGDWSGELIADRPGEDFAWMVDGKPAGRFVVAGSHLVEGHR